MTNTKQTRRRTPLDVEIGARLRAGRLAKGMSQTVFGHALGVTFQQVQKYERGFNTLSPTSLVKACDVLGITIETLLGLTGSPRDPIKSGAERIAATRRGSRLVLVWDRLAERHKDTIVNLAESLAP